MEDISANLKIFKALSDENRIKILEQIRRNEVSLACENPDCVPEDICVTSLASSLEITPATASHHIKELAQAGLITTVKKGRWVYCQVNQEAFFRVAEFIKQLKEGKP